MQIFVKCVASLGILLTTQQAIAAPTTDQVKSVMRQTIEDVVRPAYQNFGAQTELLKNQVSQLCTSPNNAALSTAQNQFTTTAHSWASIELFRSGPVMDKNRLERVLFYPDRKSTGLKQVQRLVAKGDLATIAPDIIDQKSVAVQGLGALEFLLFGTGHSELSTKVNSFRCQFAASVTNNLHSIATELQTKWNSEYSEQWINTGQKNSVFINDQEAVIELLGTVVHGLEAIKDIRLKAFLREEQQRDRPKSALFWRSENTLSMMKANLEFVHSLLRDGGLYSLVGKNSRIADQIEFELKQNKKAINAIEGPLLEALKDPALRKKLVYFGTSLTFAIDRIDQQFAQELGLSSGFSFSDGD
ncbi:imelysin family protein [Lentilitoribacter sp. EG35]|uniref:imelysin family protein n=1 Tax=Lentilitoribacter sp. EG35 TaxID=3234192 RepID=UPI00345F43DD